MIKVYFFKNFKIKLIKIALLISMVGVFSYCSSKILLENRADIEKAVLEEIKASAESGKIASVAKQENIKGKYVFDITVYGKGKVLTITPISNEGGNIGSQNMLKDLLYEHSFNFKMKPKTKEKIRCTLQF